MYQTYGREIEAENRTEKWQKVLQEAYENGREVTPTGTVADYIPELAKANPDSFGICARFPDGRVLAYGDVDTRFTMQSISKVVNLALALKTCGFREVFTHVLMEPSGDSFNSILKLDIANNLPYNPMINAGAIQIVSLLAGKYSFEDILGFARELCLDESITCNEAVYRSEAETGDRNRAIAYLLKSKGVLQWDPVETLDLYFRMCSLNVTARSLAGLGLVLACGGKDPMTGKQFLPPKYVRTIKSVLFTCGLYDGTGEFGVRVGVPGKSGVGGGLMCAVPEPVGIGLFGPSLDRHGNSVGALKAMEHISHLMHLHVFESDRTV